MKFLQKNNYIYYKAIPDGLNLNSFWAYLRGLREADKIIAL